ncbi:MAG: methionyl-tRNA formyltransferase [Bacteroidaceae bacterium]|nr:methionyl-tRNA formyltransferase [Bacteroidaceae bacterium]
MADSKIRIIYMGTPDFAVEPLRRLVEGGYNIVAVVTMPYKPVGRHHDVLQQSPVKQYALSRSIPVLQPERLKDETFLTALRSYEADLQVVVAFRMLPEVVWAMPRLGTFNLHAALLPQYRGAAPINWAIINGDRETGITTFFLDHDIDTGKVIYRESVPIHEDDDVEAVHDRLMMLGADLVLKTVDDVERGVVNPIPQSELAVDGPLRPAPKIFKETCQIRWFELSARQVYNFVRGLSPYPAAWTILSGTMLKIYKTSLVPCAETLPDARPGTIDTDGKKYFRVACREGWVALESLQLAGKRRMDVGDFLRGAHIVAECVE